MSRVCIYAGWLQEGEVSAGALRGYQPGVYIRTSQGTFF